MAGRSMSAVEPIGSARPASRTSRRPVRRPAAGSMVLLHRWSAPVRRGRAVCLRVVGWMSTRAGSGTPRASASRRRLVTSMPCRPDSKTATKLRDSCARSASSACVRSWYRRLSRTRRPQLAEERPVLGTGVFHASTARARSTIFAASSSAAAMSRDSAGSSCTGVPRTPRSGGRLGRTSSQSSSRAARSFLLGLAPQRLGHGVRRPGAASEAGELPVADDRRASGCRHRRAGRRSASAAGSRLARGRLLAR